MKVYYKLIKKILASIGAIAIVVGLVIGDLVCYAHENEITSWLSPNKIVTSSDEAQEILRESDTVIQRVAEEGIPLLKNNGTLPLDMEGSDNIESGDDGEDVYCVNLFGVGSTDSDVNGFFLFGGGSGSVPLKKEEAVYLKEGLENSGFDVNLNLYNYFKNRQSNPTVDWWGSDDSKSVLNYALAYSTTAIVTVSRFTGENRGDQLNIDDTCTQSSGEKQPYLVTYKDSDKDGRNFCQLSLREEAMIKWCSENFEEVIVLVNSANVMELGYLEENDGVDAVMYVPYTGQSGCNAIGKILTGEVNPSAHTTDTFAYSTSENAPYYVDAIYQNTQGANQIAYTEDIYIDYKWYETADKEGYFTSKGTTYDKVVVYPFGHGLSYTTFKWEVQGVTVQTAEDEDATVIANGATISEKNTTVTVNVKITNTGIVAGKEVVQLYTTAPYTNGGIEKAHVALTDFVKTDMLYPSFEAGEDKPNSQIVTLTFDLYNIASYDCYDKNGNGFAGYELEGGDYILSLRNNAHEVNECKDAEFTFKIGAAGFKYEKDPVTGNDVENRFTGSTAEAGTPIDGSNSVNEAITYLSRSDFAGTFPTTKFKGRTVGLNIAQNGISGYMSDSEHYADLEMPTFDQEKELLLYTLEDGSPITSSEMWLAQGSKKTVLNEDLVMKLGADYDAEEWDQLISQMSSLDVVDYVARYGTGSLPVLSISKPVDYVFDGPQGLNNTTLGQDIENASAFPCEAMMGMTYNVELVRELGAAMATEAIDVLGAIGMYAPAADVHRHPFNGRNYEQYGADSVLCGKMAAKEVYGMITHGVSACVKHFIISTPGYNPRSYNSWITEQNLRENYLRAFEYAVKDGGANFIMTSFNNVGGVMCACSYALNTQILREEWGFKGSVITDYDVYTKDGKTTANLIRSGNDLRFQASAANRSELDQSNKVDMALAARSVKNSLYTFCNTQYRAKQYDPNHTLTTMVVIPGVNWWLPCLIVLNVLLCLTALFIVFKAWFWTLVFKPKAVSGTVQNRWQDVAAEESVKAALPVKETATAVETVKTEEIETEKKAEPIFEAEEVQIPAARNLSGEQENYFNSLKYAFLCKHKKAIVTDEAGTVTFKEAKKELMKLTEKDGKVLFVLIVNGEEAARITILDNATYLAAMSLI